MSSSAVEPEAPDLVCQLDNVQGMVDALSSVRWKRHQVFTKTPNLLTCPLPPPFPENQTHEQIF